MSDQPTFPLPPADDTQETTGRYIVTFADEALTEGLALLTKSTGVSKLPNAQDFEHSALDLRQMAEAGGAVFPNLGIAVVAMDEEAVNNLMSARGDDAAILDIEPERIFYALDNEGLSKAYLRGYRDAVDHLYGLATGAELEEEVEAAVTYVDDAVSTWGLKATGVMNSQATGRGIRVAVLDTGMDLRHPDFRGRSITSKSFVPGEDVQDRHGHGTHCIGTACGFKDVNGRRYGIARESAIFVGKVLSNSGSGATSGILAGMEWAVANQCAVISMSLGNRDKSPSTAYEAAGRRALAKSCLIVAAAGNHRQMGNSDNSHPGTVGQPANSASIMAVAAVNNQLALANFSCKSGSSVGANVDIAAPGVQVYSSVPMPRRYDGTFSGTSMATPHVAGIAALYAQVNRARGTQLWQLLTSRARRLPLSASDVGAGLVQAPR